MSRRFFKLDKNSWIGALEDITHNKVYILTNILDEDTKLTNTPAGAPLFEDDIGQVRSLFYYKPYRFQTMKYLSLEDFILEIGTEDGIF